MKPETLGEKLAACRWRLVLAISTGWEFPIVVLEYVEQTYYGNL